MFLDVNGLQVFVRNATPTQKLTKVGKRGRSFRGKIRDTRRYIRQAWDCTAVVAEFDEAKALIHMLNGEGHHVDFFDGLQASTGLNALPGYQPMILRPSSWGVNGKGVLVIPDASLEGTLFQY